MEVLVFLLSITAAQVYVGLGIAVAISFVKHDDNKSPLIPRPVIFMLAVLFGLFWPFLVSLKYGLIKFG